MCVWTKKRGSMNAVVLIATPCPKLLHPALSYWDVKVGDSGSRKKKRRTKLVPHAPAFLGRAHVAQANLR